MFPGRKFTINVNGGGRGRPPHIGLRQVVALALLLC